MKRHTRIIRALSVAGVVVAALSLPGVSYASEPSADKPPAAVNNPDVPLAVIKSLPEVIQNDPTVKIPSNYTVQGPIVYPDGTPVEGQGLTQADVDMYCGGTATAPLGFWGPASVSNCSVFGYPGATVSYSWTRADGVDSQGCAQTWGYNNLGNGWWYDAQCGTKGGFVTPWGNVLATPKLRVMSEFGGVGFSADWSH